MRDGEGSGGRGRGREVEEEREEKTGDKLLIRAAALLYEQRKVQCQSVSQFGPTFALSSLPNSCLPRVS